MSKNTPRCRRNPKANELPIWKQPTTKTLIDLATSIIFFVSAVIGLYLQRVAR